MESIPGSTSSIKEELGEEGEGEEKILREARLALLLHGYVNTG